VEKQLALIRAHPELAGKAMVSKTLTSESTNEQGKAGLTDCTPEEFARIQQLNADYNAKFGFPFILAVRGPRGTGLDRTADHRDLRPPPGQPPGLRAAEALRNIHRIVELRLNDKFGVEPAAGQPGVGLAGEAGAAQRPGLRGARAADRHLPDRRAPRRAEADRADMRECGFDEVPSMRSATWSASYAAHPSDPAPRPADRLALRHRAQRRQVRRPPGHLHADGLRARTAQARRRAALRHRGGRLRRRGRPALQGHLPRLRRADRPLRPAWLEQKDADGISMREAMRHAGPAGDAGAIAQR
jgi:N-carbamoyl-L-amino-acid hydrolase